MNAADIALDNGHPHKWLILSAVSLGMFMALLDATIVNIAIPAIITDLHTTLTKVSWVLNAYNLAMVAFFLSMGRIADRYGQKRVFLGGIIVFTLFSLLCGFSPNIYWLIVFRVGQAVGGAAMAPISLSILMGAFPKRQHGQAVALWGALGTVAAAIGPTLGGLLVTYVSWKWIFFVNVPIGVGALIFALAVVPEVRRAEGGQGIDLVGILLAAGGLFCFTLGLIQGNDWGWTSARIVALLVVAVATFPVFYWWETRRQDPMFDFRLMRIRSFAAANTAQAGIGTAMGGAMLLLVIFMVTVMGYSELRAALVLTFMPATAMVVAPGVGRLIDRRGPRYPAAFGAGCFAVGLFLLAQMGASAHWYDIAWRVVILGAGIGSAMPTLAAASMGSLPPEAGGVGSGALATLRQMGFVLGVAISVSIFAHTIAANVTSATRQATDLVAAQTQITPQTKAQIISSLKTNAAAAQHGGSNPAAHLQDPVGQLPPPPPGTPPAVAQQIRAGQAKLAAEIGSIYKSTIVKAFDWPFYAGALAALLTIFPALLTGRRLGEHEGHHEMSRSKRLAQGR